jgi:osmotically-inducible protein OsmY
MTQLLSPSVALASDAEIERAIREDVVGEAFLWCSPGYVDIEVSEGRVTLRGEVESADVLVLITTGAAKVPGVLVVRSELTVAGAPSPAR